MGLIFLLAITAQAAATTSGQSLDRMREKLAAPPPRLIVQPDNIAETQPKFKLSIEAVRPVYLDPPWQPDTTVPLYVRTARPLYHHEFLTMVTPEEFRASALYPGVDVFALIDALSREISGEMREIRERRAREEVRRQHELFKASVGIKP